MSVHVFRCCSEKKKEKEEVYAVRRFWEASDRPWRPFLLPNMGVGMQASGLSMGVQMVVCNCCVRYDALLCR